MSSAEDGGVFGEDRSSPRRTGAPSPEDGGVLAEERTRCLRHSPRLVRPEVVVGAEEVDGELADRVRLLLDVLRDVPLVTDLAGPPPGDTRARDARTTSVGYHAPQGTTGQGITDLKPRRVPSTTKNDYTNTI